MGWLSNLLMLLCTTNLAIAFVVLPYIQIDYAHLIRVAHCKAKCSEKYGYPKTRENLDGSVDEYFFVDTVEYTKCENGCLQFQHRRDMKRSNLTGETLQGAKFWLESIAHSGKVGSSPVSTAELLCQMPSATQDLDDSFEGLLGLTKVRPSGPIQYVIQWKQRTYALGYYDESQWITASVESDSIIKVDGMIPGVQYKFLITVVGPAGKLGDTIQSEWTEISNSLVVKAPGSPLIAKNGFNSEQGVVAHLHFPRTAYDSCYFRLQVKNATNAVVTDIRVDPTYSIVLTHLEFDSSYAVTLSALSSDQNTATSPISVRFNSFQCKQVYGKGSLHCSPEPVSNIRVAIQANSTAIITWTPSAEPENILTYAVTYQAYLGPCNKDPTTVYLGAPSTSYEMPLPRDVHCEFMFRITNYDTIGRESFAETRLTVMQAKMVNSSLKVPLVAVGVSFTFLVVAAFVCAICRCCNKCPIKVSENKAKLTDYA